MFPLKKQNFARIIAFSALILSGSFPAMADDLIGDAAVLRTLDKVTARTQDLVISIDETVTYGTLEITVRKCIKRSPEETPETATFLEISEKQQDEEPRSLFLGWMFASSPALNALEHPVYDVWVIDCKMSSPEQLKGSE